MLKIDYKVKIISATSSRKHIHHTKVLILRKLEKTDSQCKRRHLNYHQFHITIYHRQTRTSTIIDFISHSISVMKIKLFIATLFDRKSRVGYGKKYLVILGMGKQRTFRKAPYNASIATTNKLFDH